MKIPVVSLLAALALAPLGLLAQNRPDLPPSNREFAPIPPGFDAARAEIAHGRIEYVEYASKSIGLKRRMAVYTPAGYSSSAKYPVIYLLHGRGDDETGWDVKGSAGRILDNLVAEGKIVPSIVVMPNGQASSRALDTAQQAAVTAMNQKFAAQVQAGAEARSALTRAALAVGADRADLAVKAAALAAAELATALARAEGFAALQQGPNRLNAEQVLGLRGAPAGNQDGWVAFEQDLIQDIIPYIESHYTVRTDRLNRALLGLSMGGGQTLNFGLSHQDLFAYVAAFSPAPNAKRITELVKSPEKTNQDLKLLWVSCGDVDTLVGNVSVNTLADFKQLGLNYQWRLGSGGHEWKLWKNDLYTVSQMLFR